MASRALVDKSIDAFWEAAGVPRPSPTQDFARKAASRPPRKPRSVGASRPTPRQGASSCIGPAGLPPVEPELHQDFRRVSVEISGREGYNDLAVNGVWSFWRVCCGRLAFVRDVTLDAEGSGAEHEDDEEGKGQRGDERHRGGNDGIRLFLHYSSQVDAWLISDSPSSSGCILADCGQTVGGHDMEQHWRVWDGDSWMEDRNIRAEVLVSGPPPVALQGLRVLPAGSAAALPLLAASAPLPGPPGGPRARSIDGRPSPPECPRPPLSARPPGTSRPMIRPPRC